MRQVDVHSSDSNLGIIIPTYSHFAYAQLTIESAARTPGATIIVVDDGSPGWPSERIIRGWLPTHVPFVIQRYDKNTSSLTRSWNTGLRIARTLSLDYAVCGNADLVFPRGWWEPIKSALNNFDFVGPVTNAPGHCAMQNVMNYLPTYTLDDDPTSIDETQQMLRQRQLESIPRKSLNGFCLIGRIDSFFQVNQVPFDPRIPLLGNEDDFFRRARKLRSKVAISPSSFIFHYRSVSRGFTSSPYNAGLVRLPGCTGCRALP